jgi:hypothetical protein
VFLAGMPFAIFEGRRRPLPLGWLALCGAALLLLLGQQNPVTQLIGVGHWTQLHPFGWVTLYWVVLLLLAMWPR